MKKMNAPEMEIVRFGAEDVIATSGTIATFPAGQNVVLYADPVRQVEKHGQIFDVYIGVDDGEEWVILADGSPVKLKLLPKGSN